MMMDSNSRSRGGGISVFVVVVAAATPTVDLEGAEKSPAIFIVEDLHLCMRIGHC